MENKIKVAELFAGVGGFRLGLEGWNGKSASSNYKKTIQSNYEVVWSNQWEPSTKVQHASMVYENRFGKNRHSNEDISVVVENVEKIPDHDLLVGGFPCQDYSVATTLKNSKGLIGKKGVLGWSCHKILSEKENKPKYFFKNLIYCIFAYNKYLFVMNKINTSQLLNELKNVVPNGFELSANMGLLSTTKAIYFKNELVFIFLMEYDFIFDPEIGLSPKEFKKEYKNWIWQIEQIIS